MFVVTVEDSLFGLFPYVREERISVEISKSTYEYWLHLRLKKTYNQWSSYCKVARWVVETGSGTQEIRTVVAQVEALFPDREDFVNAILQIDAQLTYNERHPGLRHPIEVLVDQMADCDGFSVFVASVLKAAGYSVILIVYEDHMQCGVHLSISPRSGGWHFKYDGAEYYICECAGQTSDWKNSWYHVGQCPEQYQGQSAQLIPV